MNIIEVENVTKNYKDFPALKDISFNVKPGEIFGLLGPNGAGKTTTIKILTTQIRPTGGNATVLGFDTVKQPEKIREKVGIVFEVKNFYPRLTVEQNLNFFARLYDKNSVDVDKVLDYIKLQNKKKEEARKLSSGMKQRLVIARALLPDPPLIFLDEPTVGLDPHIARNIRNIFKKLKQEEKTVFLTTHYMEEADELCDRVAIIDEGRIVKIGAPAELKKEMGGDKIQIELVQENDKPGKVLEFENNDPELAKTMNLLVQEEKIFNIKTKKVSLEDVFINNTGHKLD